MINIIDDALNLTIEFGLSALKDMGVYGGAGVTACSVIMGAYGFLDAFALEVPSNHGGLLMASAAITTVLGFCGAVEVYGCYRRLEERSFLRELQHVTVAIPSFAGGAFVAVVANALPQAALDAISSV